MRAMRTLISILAVVGCFALAGCDDDNPATDAGAGSDAAPVLNCANYCSKIMTNCTAGNTQYATMNHCLGSCAKMTLGAITDMTNNTVGCRSYHADNAVRQGQTPETHCPHAGPGGAAIAPTGPLPSTCGDACTSFCTLNIATCGSTEAPITGITPRYQNVQACMTACGNFSKAKPYAVSPATPTGDSLACRLYHLTNAAQQYASASPNLMMVDIHCSHAGPNGGDNAITCMAGTPPGP